MKRSSLIGYAGFCALLLILGAVLGAVGTYRTVQNTSDDYSTLISEDIDIRNTVNCTTFITCSNGNTYNATAANIQIAIDELGGNGTVYIPAGDYRFINSVGLYLNDTQVELKGMGGTHWGITGSTRFIAGANGVTLIKLKEGKSQRGMKITDIKFVSNRKYTNVTGIDIAHAFPIHIEYCGFHSINGSAILFSNSSYSPTIHECDFQHCGNGTRGTICSIGKTDELTHLIVSNCVFEACDTYSINGYANAPQFINNFFEAADGHPSAAHIYAVGANNMMSCALVEGNTFYECTSDSSAIAIWIGYSGWMIVNNPRISEYDVAIRVDGGGSRVFIEGNHIINCEKNAIFCEVTLGKITNNIIDEGGQGSYAIRVFTQNVVSGNTIKNWNGYAFDVNGDNISFSDNTVISGGALTYAFDEDPTDVCNTYIANHIISVENDVFDTGPSASSIVRDNIGFTSET